MHPDISEAAYICYMGGRCGCMYICVCVCGGGGGGNVVPFFILSCNDNDFLQITSTLAMIRVHFGMRSYGFYSGCFDKMMY